MSWISASRSTARVLDEAPGLRAMTGVMAIMVFLTVLAAALGLGTAGAGQALDRQLAGRLTIQIIEGEPTRRDAAAGRVLAVLRAAPEVARAKLVERTELERLLRPWLGGEAASAGLPVPAMIDVDLSTAGDVAVDRLARRIHATTPAARIDRHARWMSPVSGLMDMLVWLALGLVLLMAGATAAVVVLAARAGLEAHRATVEVMHMLGSTDVQIARLFQRRVTLDAAIGGLTGTTLAAIIVALVGTRLQALGSELIGGATLGTGDWITLASVPIFFIILATLAARLTITRALRQTL